MTIDWTVTFGQLLPWIMTAAGLVSATALAWLVNKVKKALIEEISTMFADIKKNLAETIEKTETKVVGKIEAVEKDFADQVSFINRRLSDMGDGHVQVAKELREFKEHVTDRYVEKNEIAELRTSIDKSLVRIENGFELANATMSDVRDSVIALTAKGGKTTVPPRRRAAPKSVGA